LAISTVSGTHPGFLTIGFNTFFSDDFIYGHPAFVQASVKIGKVAWKFITLVTEINAHLLVAWSYSAVLEKFALFISAALTVFGCKKVEHLFKIWIFLKYRFLQQCFKPLGIDVEITQFFLELDAEFSDITFNMGKTGFAAQTTRGNGFFDGVICHVAPPLMKLHIRLGMKTFHFSEKYLSG
jgi:hypothetical protein